MKDHLLIGPDRLSVRCATCHVWIAESAHCIGLACQCAGCCPSCHPELPPERTGSVVGLVGEQRGMF